jgi:hypothetical protein
VEKLLNEFGFTLSDLIKFVIAVFLPLVIWFLTLDHSIQLNAIAVEENKKQVEYIRDKQEVFNEKVLDKLEAIHKDLSEVKGRLPRRD